MWAIIVICVVGVLLIAVGVVLFMINSKKDKQPGCKNFNELASHLSAIDNWEKENQREMGGAKKGNPGIVL